MTEIKQQFIQVKTKANFEARLKAGDVRDTSIAFIEDSDQIWTKGKYYSVIPKEGHEGQILAWEANGKAKWEDVINMFSNLEDVLAYGVQFDTTVADPHLTRIGNMSFHKSLPIQSQLKGCIAQENKIMYWLNESDWRFRKEILMRSVELTVAGDVYTMVADVFNTLQYDKQWVKINGVACQIDGIDTSINQAHLLTTNELKALSLESATIPIELGAVLNGYDGTVRVYCPAFYIKSTVDGNIAKVWLSTVKIDDTYTYQPEILVDAYKSTILNTVPQKMGYLSSLHSNSAISVVNTNTYCRGGENRSDSDQYLATDPFRTDLGKPRTSLSIARMRLYAKNANSQLLSYDQYKNIFYWLYVVEYANFNSQEAYNAALTGEGYRQGGMGAGITDVNKVTEYNNANPITPCGYGNRLGNRTGLTSLTIPEFTYGTDNAVNAAQTMQVARWRGFDNPFGDIWTALEGIIIDGTVNSNPNHMHYVYTCQDASKYANTPNDSYVKIGEGMHQSGYIKSFNLGNAAHIIPYAAGGDTTKYICDYHTAGDGESTWCALWVGGNSYWGSKSGLCCLISGAGMSETNARLGYWTVSLNPHE